MTKITTDAQALAYLDTPDPKMQELRTYLRARLASTSPAPDGWVLVGYGMRSNVDGSIAREFVPAGWRTTTELLEKFHQEPWVVNGRASIVSFYAAPQPVVEKDNG